MALPDEARERIDHLLKTAFQLRELEQWDRMIALADEAEALSREVGYTSGMARAAGIRGFCYYIRADYRKALASCMEALQLAEAGSEDDGKIRVVLALVQWSLGNYEEALRQCDRGRTLLQQSGDIVNEAFAWTTRGGILQTLGELEEGLRAHQHGLDLFRGVGYGPGVARALTGVGSVHLALGRLDDALACQRESLDIARKLDHRIGISRALNDIAEIYEAQNDLDGAYAMHRESLALRRAEGYRHAEITSLCHIGRLLARRGDMDAALAELHRARDIAGEIEARPKICQVEHELALTYEAAGRLREALEHFRACDLARTQLATDQSTLRHKALELESQLEFARKDAEIHRLRNIELKQLLDRVQAMQAELINSEKMAALGGLVAGIAHEINNPLGVVRASADTAVRCSRKLALAPDSRTTEALEANLRLIADATRRIETTVNRLKSFAGIDRAEYTVFDPVATIEEALALLESEFNGRITVPREYGAPLPRIHGYAAELGQVFMNLLRNAGEAIDGAGTVCVRTALDGERMAVAICDSGRGIPPEHLQSIFVPGFNRSASRVKASLSLFTCLAIVRKHGGDIEVESTPGKGSTFTVVLPRSLEHAAVRPAAAAAS